MEVDPKDEARIRKFIDRNNEDWERLAREFDIIAEEHQSRKRNAQNQIVAKEEAQMAHEFQVFSEFCRKCII